jgi:hypothetical protein
VEWRRCATARRFKLTKSSGLWGAAPQKGIAGIAKNTAASGAAVGSRWLRKGASYLQSVEEITALAAKVAQMELEAEEDLKEFADGEKQRGKVGMYLAGGPVALYDQKKHRESGLVYRKRDAVKDGLKGTAANYGAALGTGAGVGLGALGLGALAAKGKLPKGMLRKVGVKAGQAVKKGSPKLLVGTGLAASAAGLGAHLKVQHGSAEKRRKEALVARLQGGGQ